MNSTGKSWLDLYVDAMLEKDPYKRLAMVRKLRNVSRQDEDDAAGFNEVPLRGRSKRNSGAAKNRQR